jgi:hypothetical protein
MISDRDLHEGPEESREKRTCPALKSKYYSSMLRKHSSVRVEGMIRTMTMMTIIIIIIITINPTTTEENASNIFRDSVIIK